LKADLKANGLKVPIQTREVDGIKFVIDGRTRLDLMEELGWQIVDEHGKWIGAMLGKAEDKFGCSTWQIVKDVISYNGNRRHVMSKQALVACIDGTLKAVQSPDFAKLAKSVKRGAGGRLAGSTKDEHKAAVVEHAEQAGISKRTVERTLAKTKSAAPAPPKPKPKKEQSFEDQVWRKWSSFLNNWSPADRKHMKPILHQFTALRLEHWDAAIFRAIILQFMKFMDRNWQNDWQTKEALELVHGWADPKSKERS
jgi:hypothetical protein